MALRCGLRRWLQQVRGVAAVSIIMDPFTQNAASGFDRSGFDRIAQRWDY